MLLLERSSTFYVFADVLSAAFRTMAPSVAETTRTRWDTAGVALALYVVSHAIAGACIGFVLARTQLLRSSALKRACAIAIGFAILDGAALQVVWRHRALPIGVGAALVAACCIAGVIASVVCAGLVTMFSPRARGKLAFFVPGLALAWMGGALVGAARGPSRPGGETVDGWTRVPTGMKVAIIAIDGLDGRLVDDAIAAGRLPNLRAILDRGARGPLRSIRPPRSPVVWTSAMTGVLPREHGILDFVVRRDGERIPVTSNLRRANALWNLAAPLDFTMASIHWYVTWPAESVRGAVVSDRVDFDGLEGRVFPDALTAAIDSARAAVDARPERDPRRLTEMTEPFADFRAARWGQLHRSLGILDDVVRHDLVTLAAAEVALARGQPDLTAVYFRGTDNTQHLFWKHRLAASNPTFAKALYGPMDAAEVAALSPVIDRYYDFADDLLGRVVALLDPETVLFVVSDHGFLTNNERGHWYSVDRLLIGAALAIADSAGPWIADHARSEVFDEAPPSTSARRVLRAGGADADAALDRAHAAFSDAKTDRGERVFRSMARGEDETGPWLAVVFHDRLAESAIVPLMQNVPVREFVQPEGHSGDHRMDGFLAAAGPPIRPGRLSGARAVDLAPTVLHLLGGPAAHDAEGVVLANLFDPTWSSEHPVRYVRSWGTRKDTEAGAISTEADARIREELEALGYLR